MPFNPNDATHLSRLRRAREQAFKQLQPFRVARMQGVREMVGKHYGHDGGEKIKPVNMTAIMVQSYARSLVSQNPAFDVVTSYANLRPYVQMFKLALEDTCKEIALRDTLERMVIETMFGLAIVKVGLTATADNATGAARPAASPFADVIGLHNWVHDVHASRWDQVQYCGDRYSVPLEEVLENPAYKKEVREKAQATGSKGLPNSGTDQDPNNIGSGQPMKDDRLHKEVRLWDIWLPRDKLLLTITDDQDLPPLRVIEWERPARGPYHPCWYDPVPDNLMPLAPALGIYDLDVMVNQLFRKLGQQAERQRTVLAFQDGAGADAQRVLNTADGEGVKVGDINAVKEFRLGGADQATMGVAMQFRQLASYVGGNLDTIAGLMAGSDTVGQDQLMAAQSSQRIKAMQDRVESVTADIGRDLGEYLWDSDVIKRLRMKVEGTDIEYDQYWGPDQRVGAVYQYRVDVKPHSMKKRTPEERTGLIQQLLGQMIMPLMPVLQQQGYTIDAHKLVRMTSEDLNLPQLMEIVIPADPGMAMMEEQESSAPMPAAAQRPPVSRGKGHQQRDPFLDGATQMASAARSNENTSGARG